MLQRNPDEHNDAEDGNFCKHDIHSYNLDAWWDSGFLNVAKQLSARYKMFFTTEAPTQAVQGTLFGLTKPQVFDEYVEHRELITDEYVDPFWGSVMKTEVLSPIPEVTIP